MIYVVSYLIGVLVSFGILFLKNRYFDCEKITLKEACIISLLSWISVLVIFITNIGMHIIKNKSFKEHFNKLNDFFMGEEKKINR